MSPNSTSSPRTATPAPTRQHHLLAAAWFALAVVGLVGTWMFNLRFFANPQGLGYLQGWFANPASSSAAVDIIVVALAACLLFVVEGSRLGWSRWAWVFIPVTFIIAAAFSVPLFLGLRELALARRQPAQ